MSTTDTNKAAREELKEIKGQIKELQKRQALLEGLLETGTATGTGVGTGNGARTRVSGYKRVPTASRLGPASDWLRKHPGRRQTWEMATSLDWPISSTYLVLDTLADEGKVRVHERTRTGKPRVTEYKATTVRPGEAVNG